VQALSRVPPRMRHAAPQVQASSGARLVVNAPHIDSPRQCTKAGVECSFYDHGRAELLPRRCAVRPPALLYRGTVVPHR
jgi:hypothetical protein